LAIRHPHAIAFNPDASVIAVGSYGNGPDLLRLFSTKNASTVDVYPEPASKIETLDWSSDGRFIAFVTGRRVLHLWIPLQLKTTERQIALDGEAYSLAFSPDGRELAVGVDRNVKIFSIVQ
jgi:WD40 repeat protein